MGSCEVSSSNPLRPTVSDCNVSLMNTNAASQTVTTKGIAYYVSRVLVGVRVEINSDTKLTAYDDDDNATMKAVIEITDAEASSVAITYCTTNGVIHGEASLSGLSEAVIAGLVSSMLRNG